MKEVFKQQAQSTKEVAVIGPVVAVEIGVMKSINHFAQNPPYFCFYFIVINRNAMARLLRKEIRNRKQINHKEPRSFHTFHKFSHVLTTGRLSTRKT